MKMVFHGVVAELGRLADRPEDQPAEGIAVEIQGQGVLRLEVPRADLKRIPLYGVVVLTVDVFDTKESGL